jgi:pilus assembly protein CpaC
LLAGQLLLGEEPAGNSALVSGYLQSASQISAELNTLKPAAVQAAAEVPLVEAKPLPMQSAGEEHLAPIVPAWAMQKRPGQGSGVGVQGSGGKGQGATNPQSQIQNPYIGRQQQPQQPLKMASANRESGVRSREQVASPKSAIQNPKSKISAEPVVQTAATVPVETARPAETPRLPAWVDGGRSRETVNGAPVELSPDQDPGSKPLPEPSASRNLKAKPPQETLLTAETEVALPLARPQAAPSAKPIQNSKSKIQNASPVRTAEFEARLLGQPEKEADAFRKATAKEDEFGKLPEGSPFEAIPQSGGLKLRVRRSILLRTKVDIYRTAIVDQTVCDIVQFTPREVSIIGRSVGQTHVTFWFDDPAMAPLTYLVEVKADSEQVKADEDKYQLLENVVNEMFPDSKIHLVIVADKLLVKGQAKDSEEAAQIMNIVRAQGAQGARGGGVGGYGGGYGGGVADSLATPVLSQAATGGNPGPGYQIINMLRVPGVQQVALKVKIADLNRTAARGFGVDVFGTVNLSNSINGSKLFLASLLNASATGGTALITQFDGDDINLGVRYLQERGVIRLLSEPTLVTLSGRPATFVAGGEFAVPTIVGSVGLNAVTTDFRSFGAIISFLPTIVDKDRIRLQVAPEFSQLNNNLKVNNTPGLNVRAATTTVEMREGQTLAIAGLLEDSYTASTAGNLPGLAKIFGRRDTSRSETELIILVTPELVHPLEPEEVPPLPGFDLTEPNNHQFFLCGEIEGNPTQDYRSTVWPRLRRRYGMGGPAMTSGPFGHGQ